MKAVDDVFSLMRWKSMKNFHYHGRKDFTRMHIYYMKESFFYKVGLIKVKVLQIWKFHMSLYGT